MKLFNHSKVTHLKAATLAVSLAFSGMAINAVAADEVAVDTYNNSNWQKPLAAEFDKIDTSGNGLILPNEATKAKAFNAKTFAKADFDHNGSIDLREYEYFKTGAWPVEVPVNVVNAASVDMMAVPATEEDEAMLANQKVEAQQAPEAQQAVEMHPGHPSEVPEKYNVRPETGEPQAGEMSLDNSTSEPVAVAQKRSVGNVVDDAVITTKAKAAIFNAEDLKSLQISVETRKGEVLLSGFVDSEAAKAKAEALVTKIQGVQSVKNGLEVKSN